jgi:hypothetical protein
MNIPVRRGKEVKAERGTTLRCKGWRQEAILRLLENNLENAEDPDNLVIYMSIARAARDWKSFDRIVATLTTLREDQTFVMQSGKPIGVFPGQSTTPLVIMANGNIVGEWSGEENRRKLDDMGLTVYPGMTAAAWQYIGRHVRNFHGDRPPAFWRHAQWTPAADLRLRRHERRAAACRQARGRVDAGDRGRSGPHRPAHRQRLLRRHHRQSR